MFGLTEVLLLIALLVGFTVLPVMLIAKMLEARKTGFGSALLAVFIQACVSGVIHKIIPNNASATIIVVIIGSIVFSYILDTTVWRGFGISIFSALVAISFVAILLAL